MSSGVSPGLILLFLRRPAMITHLKEAVRDANNYLRQAYGGKCTERVSEGSIRYYLKNITSLVEYAYSDYDDDTTDNVYVAEVTNDLKSRIAKAAELNPNDIEGIMFELWTYTSGSLPNVQILVKAYNKDFAEVFIKDPHSLALALIADLEKTCHNGEPYFAGDYSYQGIFYQLYGGDPWKSERQAVGEANKLLREYGIPAYIDFEEVQCYLDNILSIKRVFSANKSFHHQNKYIIKVSSSLKTELARSVGSINGDDISDVYIVIESDHDNAGKVVGVPKGHIVFRYTNPKNGHRHLRTFVEDDYALGIVFDFPQMHSRKQMD